MGQFKCHCGNVISDVRYPCPLAGELKWQPETDAQDKKATEDIAEFLGARENGNRDKWIENYFLADYPLDITDADVISDIFSKAANEQGRNVYRCPECESLYVQKELYSNEWTQYKKVN